MPNCVSDLLNKLLMILFCFVLVNGILGQSFYTFASLRLVIVKRQPAIRSNSCIGNLNTTGRIVQPLKRLIFTTLIELWELVWIKQHYVNTGICHNIRVAHGNFWSNQVLRCLLEVFCLPPIDIWYSRDRLFMRLKSVNLSPSAATYLHRLQPISIGCDLSPSAATYLHRLRLSIGCDLSPSAAIYLYCLRLSRLQISAGVLV